MAAKVDDISIQSQDDDIHADIGSWIHHICGRDTVKMERARTLRARYGHAKLRLSAKNVKRRVGDGTASLEATAETSPAKRAKFSGTISGALESPA